MRTVRTPRLRLIPVTAQNAKELWALLQQADLRAYQDLPNMGLAAFREMVAKRPVKLHASAVGRFEWLICLPSSRRPLGWVSLRIAERDPASAEIGYTLLREHRGRGIATEAVRALLGEAFDYARLRRVQAYCVPENDSSRRLLARIGFDGAGVLPHGATVGGRPVDVLMYTMERDQWCASGKTMLTPASGYPA